MEMMTLERLQEIVDTFSEVGSDTGRDVRDLLVYIGQLQQQLRVEIANCWAFGEMGECGRHPKPHLRQCYSCDDVFDGRRKLEKHLRKEHSD